MKQNKKQYFLTWIVFNYNNNKRKEKKRKKKQIKLTSY